MVYPNSPFNEKLDTNLIFKTQNESLDSSSIVSNSNLEDTFKWLCSIPKMTSIRINKLKSSGEDILAILRENLSSINHKDHFEICAQSQVEDTLLVHFSSTSVNDVHPREVVIDADCGAAVLRGAHIFAPGVLGMTSDCRKNDQVSIYVDLTKSCKRGMQKIFSGPKLHIGNGTVLMPRTELYGTDIDLRGIAVEVTETISGCPQISESLFPPGSVLLQNLPSIVCVHTLDPQPNEVILDMCAAPGHKTSHIAALMENQGTLIAIDKTPGKIKKLMEHCSQFNAKVQIFLNDSTKICNPTSQHMLHEGPPFADNTFDRILLDAPCSALGKRPQFRNDITNKVLQSYIVLQKKLFRTAFELLKPNGVLVYSTCTITLSENEEIVAWALKKFDLKLVKSKVHIGSPGLEGTSLTSNEILMVQRFGPTTACDSIGFFIACFKKC